MGRLALRLALCLGGSLLLRGQSAVVGTKSTDGKISFEAVEDFLIGQDKKIKFLPENTATVDANVLKRLAKADLPQAGIIRNDGTGRLVRLNGAGKPVDIVLPDNFALKAPAKISEVPGRLVLTVVHSKKAKQSETLAPETFFAYLNGATPDQAVLQFVSESWAFKNLDEQLAAMAGFVASFKDSAAVGEFRSALERTLREGLQAFEDGGPDKNLRALEPYAVMAKNAFAGYGPIARLHDQIFGRVHFVDSKIQLLKSLAVLGDWDKFLDEYQDFERYQWSFAPMMSLRQEALSESARTHSRRALGFQLRGDHAVAIQEASLALKRDPNNKDIQKFIDGEHVVASQIAAKENESKRKLLAKGSPQEAAFNRNLTFADKYIQDKNFAQAQEQIQEAEVLNPGAPEILLRRARLVAAQDRLTEALRFLDEYDSLVVDPGERQKGQDARNDILYDLGKKRTDVKQQIEALKKSGEYSKLDGVLRSASKMDPDDPDFQYEGGTAAAILRDNGRAKELLTRYRDRSNSLDGDLKKRDKAGRLLALIAAPKPPVPAQGSPNWMSGRKLADGIYYCPESLAFQIPIDNVIGNKVKITFNWDKGRLNSIQTSWEDEKARRVYALLSTPGAPESEAPPPAPPGEEIGAFYFQYFAQGQLRSVHTKKPSATEAAKEFTVHVARDDKGRARLVDGDGMPAMILPTNGYVDTDVLAALELPVATLVAGNSVFNPFLWDGIHYFSARYDGQGRVVSAEEWNSDNMVRFTWEQDRLTEIRAYRKGTEYYRRTLSYSGPAIQSEDFTMNARAGHIRYVYNGKALTQIKIDNDGKDWTAKPRG